MKMTKQTKKSKTVQRKSWKEFRETGLLWFINSILHVFGWAIVLEVADLEEEVGPDKRTYKFNDIMDVYPARVRFRGFAPDINDWGHKTVATYLAKNAKALKKEAEE